MLRKAIAKYEADNGAIPCPTDAESPMEVLLRSLPDFEHRALRARQRSQSKMPLTPAKGSNEKR
jgi:hypothetical protein